MVRVRPLRKRACIVRTTTRQPQTVFGEERIGAVEKPSNGPKARESNQTRESNGGVELSKDFDPGDPCAIREASLDRRHEFRLASPIETCVKRRVSDVRRSDAVEAVAALEEANFAPAQWAIAVEEDLDAFLASLAPVSGLRETDHPKTPSVTAKMIRYAKTGKMNPLALMDSGGSCLVAVIVVVAMAFRLGSESHQINKNLSKLSSRIQ